MPEPPSVFAIDFGTSNSLLAAASADQVFAPARLDDGAPDPTVLRSALYFRSLDDATFGWRAPQALLDNGFNGRLIRSIKRHLPSRSFTSTTIGHRQANLEDLIGAFLRFMREKACSHFDADVRAVVMGRPARFSSDADDDALAEERLARAARRAGFEEISFCPEPVAAAYDFAEALDEPRIVLVADLGGGTSDFTLVRMSRRGFAPQDILGVGGVSVAGDAIDGSIVRSAIAPHFGSRALYRVPFGANELSMPTSLIELLSSPGDLTLSDRVRSLKLLETIRLGLVDRGQQASLDRFVALVEDGLGFSLYEGVEGAKRRLSDESETVIEIDEPSLDIRESMTRAQLETAAQRHVDSIVACLDRVLGNAGVAHAEVEIACLTGGTSRVPLVAAAFEARLPQAKLRRLSSFHSVVQGLAHRAREVARNRPHV